MTTIAINNTFANNMFHIKATIHCEIFFESISWVFCNTVSNAFYET